MIEIISIGKFRSNSPEAQLFAEYNKRLPKHFSINLTEIPDGKNEAEIMLKKAAGKFKVILDAAGKNLDTLEFAKFMNKNLDKKPCFLIGGAAGHEKQVKESADFTLSLSAMTWPHLLVRTMLAEQIYRAFAVINNHPYNK